MVDVQIGDVVAFKKGHPCGANRWRVYRVGADIGLQCLGCQRRQLMPRSKFNKAFKHKLDVKAEDETHE